MSQDIVTIKHKVFGLSPGKTAEQIEESMEYHIWRIFIEGPPKALARIDHVQYILLDPSFSKQVVDGNSQDFFSYEVNGYGSISVEVRIFVKNKPPNTPIVRNYYLDISVPEGSGTEINLDK